MAQMEDLYFICFSICRDSDVNELKLTEIRNKLAEYMGAVFGDNFKSQEREHPRTHEKHLLCKLSVPKDFDASDKLFIRKVVKEDKKRTLPKGSPFEPDTTLEEVFYWKENHGLHGSCRKELDLPSTTYQRKIKKAKELMEKYRDSDYKPTLRDLGFVGKEDM